MAITPKYQAYLYSNKWKTKRLKVLKRDNYLCQICKEKRAWQVHHKTYERIFNERLSDLLSVCGNCHMKAHNIEKPKKISIFGGFVKVLAKVIR